MGVPAYLKTAAGLARRPIGKLSAGTFHFMDRLVRKHSLKGNADFYRNDQFPWVQVLESKWEIIRKELDRVLARVDELPDVRDLTPRQQVVSIHDKWRMFAFYAYGRAAARNCRYCPETSKALRAIPGLKTGFFSFLVPRTYVAPHKGLYAGIIRCHLALKVPAEREKCWIRVGSEVRHWEEGKCLLFDDYHIHEVLNDTGEIRVVLILDIKRPLPFWADVLNEMVLWALSRTAYLTESYENQEKWEAVFHR